MTKCRKSISVYLVINLIRNKKSFPSMCYTSVKLIKTAVFITELDLTTLSQMDV